MFSKEEAAIIRKDFWTSYGKSFPRKWLLYNTKIKGFTFKFYADNEKAQVVLDIEPKREAKREALYQQVEALKTILTEEYLPEVIFSKNYTLETGKKISRIYVQLDSEFNIYSKNTWGEAYSFFNKSMERFELWFYEHEEFIKLANI
tara:strand:- start:7797 stop:8237 length:441 start_codon:yes stop_codon:yes gene_type:complete